MKKLILETTAPFQGLPELVAYDEGLFAREGLDIAWADRDEGVDKKVELDVVGPQGIDPFSSHGRLLERGEADMYNACEWGNYCRVQDTRLGSRQVGRRINADKRAYLHYFIDYHAPKDPEIGRLKPDDIRESRIVVCDPAPIPLDEMQRTYDWLKSWGMLAATASPLELVNMDVQAYAHQAA